MPTTPLEALGAIWHEVTKETIFVALTNRIQTLEAAKLNVAIELLEAEGVMADVPEELTPKAGQEDHNGTDLTKHVDHLRRMAAEYDSRIAALLGQREKLTAND